MATLCRVEAAARRCADAIGRALTERRTAFGDREAGDYLDHAERLAMAEELVEELSPWSTDGGPGPGEWLGPAPTIGNPRRRPGSAFGLSANPPKSAGEMWQPRPPKTPQPVRLPAEFDTPSGLAGLLRHHGVDVEFMRKHPDLKTSAPPAGEQPTCAGVTGPGTGAAAPPDRPTSELLFAAVNQLTYLTDLDALGLCAVEPMRIAYLGELIPELRDRAAYFEAIED